MIVRALNSSGDWTFGSGSNSYLSGKSALMQKISSRILMVLGDCFFATDQGIPWFDFLGSKNLLALDLAIRAVILNTVNVTGITSATVNLDSVSRAASVNYEVSTVFGPVNGVITQTLGVSVMPFVPNLLVPQFSQVLLNNVGATAISGIVFNSAVWWEIDLEYYIERRTATQSFNERGKLILAFDPKTSLWTLDKNVLWGSSGPTTGVSFSVNSSTGQVLYASDNMTGSSYVGNLTMQSSINIPAGA